MDVNTVLQNTRQYFQGVPTSSPASGELAPGASVGYNSPPVSSTATVTATNPYPLSFPPQTLLPPAQPRQTGVSPWSSSNSAHNAAASIYQSSSSAAATATLLAAGNAAYSKGIFSPTLISSQYQMYDNAARSSPKMLPSSPSMPAIPPQHNYLRAPSVTRSKESPSHDMYNMNSIISQPNLNHVPNKKLKIKSSVLTTTTSTAAAIAAAAAALSPSASPSMLMYGNKRSTPPQPALPPPQHQSEESHYYNHISTAPPLLPPSPASAMAIASRLPSILAPSSHAIAPTQHQLHRRAAEQPSPNHSAVYMPSRPQPTDHQRVDYHQQQQTSYHVRAAATSIEKLTPRESSDLQLYNYRRIETSASAAIETAAPPPSALLSSPSKRDSPLDLSVKTIRQSADSTAHDEAEAAAAHAHAAAAHAFGQHHPFPLVAHQPQRVGVEMRHPHLPQLPYASTIAPGVRSSVPPPPLPPPTFNGTSGGRSTSHYYRDNAYPPLANGHLAAAAAAAAAAGAVDDHGRMPVSEFHNQMTVSITYEQKQQIRTQVNTQISATQYSHHQYYRHTLQEEELKSKVPPPRLQPQLPPPLPAPPPPQTSAAVNHVPPPSLEVNHRPPALQAATIPRKRRPPSHEPAVHHVHQPAPPPAKNPRTASWRESIEKDIDNRLQEHITKKAREEQEEERQQQSRLLAASKKTADSNTNSYQNNNGESAAAAVAMEAPSPPRTPYSPAAAHPEFSKKTAWLYPPSSATKGQHKLPVQPVQMHPPTQSWYPPPPQQQQQHPMPQQQPQQMQPRSYPPYENTQCRTSFSDAHLPPTFGGRPELKMVQEPPLPSFQVGFAPKPLQPELQPPSVAATDKVITDKREKAKSEMKAVQSSMAPVKKESDEEAAQARAALMASALTHPRIRTKAELKQGTPVDKSKEKVSTNDTKLPENTDFCGSQSANADKKADFNHTDDKSKLAANNQSVNHRSSASESETSVGVDSKPYFPRKKLLSKTEENRINSKRNSSETTVFEFRDSDSEPEASSIDLQRLNEMRKDRKTKPPSVSPTTATQLDEELPDDSKWEEAFDELIQQLCTNNQRKTASPKKKADHEADTSQSPSPPPPTLTKRLSSTDDVMSASPENEVVRKNEKPAAKRKLVLPKNSAQAQPISAKRKKQEASPAAEAFSSSSDENSSSDSDSDSRSEPEQQSKPKPVIASVERRGGGADKQNSSSEVRGQRSNVSTTRIRIQNQLDDSSDSDEKKDDDSSDSDAESVTRSESNSDDDDDDDEEEDEDSEEEFQRSKAKKTSSSVSTKTNNKRRIQLRNKKIPLSRATLMMKNKNNKNKKKTLASKKLKKVDGKREKIRHMILRRMETRKSKIEAAENLRKAKSESASSADEPQPRMTRKMALRESQKETKKEETVANGASGVASKKKSSPSVAAKSLSKSKTSDRSDEKTKSKNAADDDESPPPSKRARDEDNKKAARDEEKPPKRPETRKQARDVKAKIEEKKNRNASPEAKSGDEVTRRSLRSRNVVVLNEKTSSNKTTSNSKNKDEAQPQQPAPKNHQQPIVQPKDAAAGKDKTTKIKKEPRNEDEPKETTATVGEKSSSARKNASSNVKEKPNPSDKERQTKGDKKESDPTWQQELFNFKYSLRMPVQLINISGPHNWSEVPSGGSGGGGHASSLPDLDRNETDSDILESLSTTKSKPTKKKNKDETKFSNTQEFKDSVKFLQEKFDKKIEEKNQQASSNLTKLMLEKKIKTIPKSANELELLPTPQLPKQNSGAKKEARGGARSKEAACKTFDETEPSDIAVEDSLIGYFRKETVDEFKDLFDKQTSKRPNQFQTVILESRTRTQTKELKHHATLKQVFGCDNRPASAPPVPDTNGERLDAETRPVDDHESGKMLMMAAATTPSPTKTSTNGVLKTWPKGYTKISCLTDGGSGGVGADEDADADSDKDSHDFEDGVDFLVDPEEDSKDVAESRVSKKKGRITRRKCRSSGFDYIRKKKKQRKEDDDELVDDREQKKKVTLPAKTMESVEEIQSEIRSWVVNKGIGETVLHKAARLGYVDISSYCLEKMNCAPSPTDNAGYTPLHEACTRGHLKIAKMLLKYGADVSASAKGGIRPLHEAVENGNVELIRLLLSYGADPLLSTYAGLTPLSLVKENKNEVKDFLVLYLNDIQGRPSMPWCFDGVDNFDHEMNGYNPLEDPPSPESSDEVETLEFEMSDSNLPSLYRFKDEFDHWVLSTDLPTRVRDAVTRRSHSDQSPSQYVVRKISRSQFEENVNCVMCLENKHVYKSKSKSTSITMVKYNDKLLSTLNIQKLNLTS